MKFAQALAQIEEHLNHGEYIEAGLLLDGHADSIVQLGKVAAQMREQVHLPWVHPDLGYRPLYIDEDIIEAAAKLDKLMNGGEDDK